ncbi:MAG: 1-acyl-sn-glycerol-3-phosphate acyltransferase [Solirubrobacteraceae bacterium]
MRVRDVTWGPIFPDEGPTGKRLIRRARGAAIEVLALLVLTALLPAALLIALVVDLVLWARTRKPLMALRLVAMAWWFLLNELHGMLSLLWIYASSGGRDTLRRRRGVYNLRIRWARIHLAGIRTLFGLKFEIEGLEQAGPGPVVVLIRHASIIDNMLPDAVLAHAHGIGLRYVIKRELQMIPTIDIGGRWVPTNFVRRASGDVESELAKLRALADDLGREGILIYPEGTRHTDAKLARAQEIIAEKQPHIAHLADRLHHVLPPRLGGPLALLGAARGADVVLFGHVGLDGFEYISDIWRGGLIGTPVKLRFWRFPAEDVPEGEDALTEWLYARWQTLDDWIGEQRGHAPSSASPVVERA